MENNPVLEIVAGVSPKDPATAERFYQWLNEEHVPHIFDTSPMYRKIMNCRRMPVESFITPIVKDYPEYLTIFEYNSKKEFEEFLARVKGRPAPAPASDEWGTEIGYKKIWLVNYEVSKAWER